MWHWVGRRLKQQHKTSINCHRITWNRCDARTCAIELNCRDRREPEYLQPTISCWRSRTYFVSFARSFQLNELKRPPMSFGGSYTAWRAHLWCDKAISNSLFSTWSAHQSTAYALHQHRETVQLNISIELECRFKYDAVARMLISCQMQPHTN